ncbi:GTP-binding protein REM 1-like [Amphibalanus amphitrite]|uniref:GTP-binding protein REM 1-like n=1 Tax=Amphibalanus amphitrite TaxID=1232801 RepID=UPI001C9173DC|nr:GTP-binding protein REM 1-like [Amphibalanus amphitrite]
MTCGESSSCQEVKRSQSCRSPASSIASRRKISLVHFSPVPQTEVDRDCLQFDEPAERLRNFVSTKRGRIVNRGDSFRRERRKSSLKKEELVNAIAAEQRRDDESNLLTRSVTMPAMPDPLRPAADEERRVLLLGAVGVGKTALGRQFLTSEYTMAYEQTVDYDQTPSQVNVCLDGVETELTVEKRTSSILEMPDEAAIRTHDAIIVVYSVTDAGSFGAARGLCLRISEMSARRPVIVVANKCDLVRLRKVSSKEGRSLAVQYGYKYIETSVVINSNIDELLAGIVAQIRFYRQFEELDGAEDRAKLERLRQRREKRIKSRTLPSTIVKEIFHKVIGQKAAESRSCQNLLIV